MLKNIFMLGSIFLVFVLTTGYTNESEPLPVKVPWCYDGNRYCEIGGHNMSTDLTELVVGEGFVCTPNKRICTNGYRTIHSTDEIEVAAALVLCDKKRKTCSIGRHVMRSSGEPLFVLDEMVCSADKKTCTNGNKYTRSSVPLF